MPHLKTKSNSFSPTTGLSWLFLSFALFLGTGLSSELPKKAQRAFKSFNEALAERDFVEAQRHLTRAEELVEQPAFEVIDSKSRLLLLRGDYLPSLIEARNALDLATNPVQEAIALNRIGVLQYETAHLSLGDSSDFKALVVEDRLDEAEASLRRSLEISGGRLAAAWFNLAEVLHAGERTGEAQHAIEQHLSLTPKKYVTSRATKLHACLEVLENEEDQRIYTLKSKDNEVTKPMKISGVNPRYTEAARQNRIQGVAIIESVITKTGEVVCTKVIKGLPLGLSRAATDAINTWKFEPSTLEGEPVPVTYNLTVNFRLEVDTNR